MESHSGRKCSHQHLTPPVAGSGGSPRLMCSLMTREFTKSLATGLAVEDPSAPHGLKLAIEDYPFANDGLLIWDSLKEWVTDYVNHYYQDSSLVQSDQELQAWWAEVRKIGHGDKRDAAGWPELNTTDDLIQIVTTIMWVTSGHHAAVNFGQYHYGGYFPNRPTIARTKIPLEDPTEPELK
ncbi:hypothetical protein CRG98_018526, partial [Punica granatum]